jgi:restriction system protein
MWMVRNNGGEYADEFIRQNIVAIGWKDVGPLKNLKTREQIIQQVRTTWPEYKPMKAVVSGSQLDKIANVMQIDDRVITYDPSKRIYHIGRIAGEYEFDPQAEDVLAHRRKVTWENEIERDRLSVPSKNSLGSTLTVFEIPEKVEKEIDTLLSGKTDTATQPDRFATNEAEIKIENILEDLKSRAKEFIKDKIANLDWDEMQQLVAGVLRAMGYKTRISPQGPDRGKDIVASPDGFGFEQPRIVVEVKHRPNQQMGSQEIRSFLGGRHKDDRGLTLVPVDFRRMRSTKVIVLQSR